MTILQRCLALATLGFGLVARAQGNFDQTQIKDIPVAGNIHMFLGAGGNIGVSSGPDGLLMVDDQFAPLAEKIEAKLKDLNSGKLRFVLNTHWHGDHTGGNAHFGADATIVAHANVRKRLVDQRASREKNPNEKVDPKATELPIITFEQGASVYFNGEEIRLIHLGPGHTDTDSVVIFTGSKVVHMGDHFFKDRFPYIDLGSGGSVAGFVKNIETILPMIPADAKVIPGHGDLATVDDLKRFHEMLVETTGLIRKEIAEGKSLDEAKKAGLPEKYKSWGGGFINAGRWIEICYNSLSSK
jgi:cyclase